MSLVGTTSFKQLIPNSLQNLGSSSANTTCEQLGNRPLTTKLFAAFVPKQLAHFYVCFVTILLLPCVVNFVENLVATGLY